MGSSPKLWSQTVVELLIEKSSELNIDLNAVTNCGNTAFHLACSDCSRENIVKLIMKNAEAFNIDLTAKNKDGKTGLQLWKGNDIGHLT